VPRRSRLSLRVSALAAVVLVAVAGCGRAGARGEVRSVTDTFLTATHDGNGARACAQLSDETRSKLVQQEGKACAQAITDMHVGAGSVTSVRVYITSAKADLSDGDSVFLDQSSSGWRISAAGCRPQEGKPADRPLQCELED
jgi:hypothetical protein